jgi:hypothetical protein
MLNKPFFAVVRKAIRPGPETYDEFIDFETEDDFREWIETEEKRAFSRGEYRAFKCLPITVHATMSIEVELDGEGINTAAG